MAMLPPSSETIVAPVVVNVPSPVRVVWPPMLAVPDTVTTPPAARATMPPVAVNPAGDAAAASASVPPVTTRPAARLAVPVTRREPPLMASVSVVAVRLAMTSPPVLCVTVCGSAVLSTTASVLPGSEPVLQSVLVAQSPSASTAQLAVAMSRHPEMCSGAHSAAPASGQRQTRVISPQNRPAGSKIYSAAIRSGSTMAAARDRSTDSRRDTPRSCMVTPYSRSMRAIVS